jgi:hypothetical protein
MSFRPKQTLVIELPQMLGLQEYKVEYFTFRTDIAKQVLSNPINPFISH